MLGRGDGGTPCAEEPGVPASLAALLPSPLLLPPMAQSHRMVWEPCPRLGSLPERTGGILGLSWEEGGGGFWHFYAMQGVCWAPGMPKQFHAARGDGSLQSGEQGQHTAGESPCWGCWEGSREHRGSCARGKAWERAALAAEPLAAGQWAREHSRAELPRCQPRALCLANPPRRESQGAAPARCWAGGGHSGHGPCCL